MGVEIPPGLNMFQSNLLAAFNSFPKIIEGQFQDYDLILNTKYLFVDEIFGLPSCAWNLGCTLNLPV